MNNRQNLILMFLIVILSFAIVSEVSAASTDDAEPGESGLKVPVGSMNSNGTEMPSERFTDVSDVPADDAIDNPHSNNDQTSKSKSPFGDCRNMTFYEHMPTDYGDVPLDSNDSGHIHEFDQRQKNEPADKTSDANNIFLGEKMDKLHIKCFNRSSNSSFGDMIAPDGVNNSVGEESNKAISELIALENLAVAFKNNKTGRNEFNGVLPQKFNDLFLPKKHVFG